MSNLIEKKKTLFNIFLSDEDNKKNISAVNDYSTELKNFTFQNKTRKMFFVETLTVIVEDNGGFDKKYAHGIELTNGIEIKYTEKKSEKKITYDGYPIKTNKDWFFYGCDIKRESFEHGKWMMSITFDFSGYVKLSFDDKFMISLNDDFTKIEDQKFLIKGYMLDL